MEKVSAIALLCYRSFLTTYTNKSIRNIYTRIYIYIRVNIYIYIYMVIANILLHFIPTLPSIKFQMPTCAWQVDVRKLDAESMLVCGN